MQPLERGCANEKSEIAAVAFSRLFLALLAVGTLASCGLDQAEVDEPVRPAGTALEASDVTVAVRRLPEFSQLTLMLESTGVGTELARMPSATLLAPRDTALAELPPRTVPAMMVPAYAATLRASLRGLALPRLLNAPELRTAIDAAGGTLSMPSVAGPPLTFTRSGEMLFVTASTGARASMGSADIGAGNGAVYVLDAWIGPVPVPLPEAAILAPPPTVAQ